MNKILIIGQAPPAVEQKVPYDTTLLYEILSWVGITKEAAQDMFEFEAVYNEFTGYDNQGNHKKPTLSQMNKHWESTLRSKVFMATKVIVLGSVAKTYIKTQTTKKVLELIHPSKRNYSKIFSSKEEIKDKLNIFLNNHT